MTTAKLITTMDELLAALRHRRDELDVTHAVLDDISGLQSGYVSKLLAPRPIKHLGPVSMPALLGALAVGLVLVEDPSARTLIEPRWERRKRRPVARCPPGALLETTVLVEINETDGDEPNGKTPVELSTKTGSCESGKSDRRG